MKIRITLLLVYIMLGYIGFSQEEKAKNLTSLIQVNTYDLKIENDQFAGSGAEILRKAIPQCQFLLVGEQHGIKEVGQFTKVLFEEGHPHGFQYMAVETDPFIATRLETFAQGELDAIKAFCAEFPFAIPFYNNTEDFDFLTTVKTKSKAKTTFWGIDQVFAAAPRYLFSRLVEIAPDDKAKTLAEEYLNKAKEGFNQAMATGRMDQVIMNTLQPEDFEQLYAAFPKATGEAHQIVQGIEKSQEIYLYWFGGQYYNNNQVRGKLMKKQFMDYYRAAQEETEQPKVIFKFGANHMEKGLTSTNIFDIGNLASELAATNGMESLHIKFTGAKGSYFNALGGPQEFDDTENWPNEFQEALQEKLNGEDWILIDMRPLRQLRMKNAEEKIKRLIFNYDIWVIPPTVHPVSAF